MNELHVSPGGAEHHGAAHPPAEEDRIPSGKILVVGIAALVVFFLGSLAAGLGMQAMRRQVNPEGPPPIPEQAGRAKIGIVEQRLFEHSNMGAAWRERQQRRLQSYGWVDKSKGIAHVPIDEAMARVEKGEHP